MTPASPAKDRRIKSVVTLFSVFCCSLSLPCVFLVFFFVVVAVVAVVAVVVVAVVFLVFSF